MIEKDAFRRSMVVLNPSAGVFPISCKTGEGLDVGFPWLEKVLVGQSIGTRV